MTEKDSNTFWNDSSNIAWFSKQEPSLYWKSFFEKYSFDIKRACDIGCGSGRHLAMLKNMGFESFGCDSSEGMVDAAQKYLINIGIPENDIKKTLTIANVCDLPYQDGYFDAAICHGVLHNLTNLVDYKQGLKECSRVLRIGGYLCVNIFTSEHIPEDFRNLNLEDTCYITKENVVMTLLDASEFIKLALELHLKTVTDPVCYESTVSTGKRSVLRCVLNRVV